ncbi:unnamed protein product [Thelazia callipaeda]|uniref:Tr-type G domain-containing protein n=1 Tax=Thelazia callipaeda TaxID=103827 RepID=A0A0N5CUA0_THECL|nr:unnamed protein product [Thelazia callipaeda]
MVSRKSLNVGVLGHVDCGKTTLAKALSTMGSTAAFDKHASASNLRANTIDLGYSTFSIDDTVIALIDCPGHGSLIKSVLAASSVFDLGIVVINGSKGIEQQTAEHLLLVSLLCPDHVIMVINKVDLITKEILEKLTKHCKKVANILMITSNLQIVPVSLIENKQESVQAVLRALRSALYTPQRVSSGHFMMFVDHCFPVKGKGTVMTGTVVDGMCKVGMDVEIAALREKRKIKSMQRWKEDVCSATIGDRAALLFQNIPSKNIDRTVIFEPEWLRPVQFLLIDVNRFVYFQGNLHQCSKLHISTGFYTVMGRCQFLAPPVSQEKNDYEIVPELDENVKFAILSLEGSIYVKEGSFYIASKLDHQGKGCRFVFYGKFLKLLNDDKEIRQYRRKQKVGQIERVENKRSVICSGLFKKEAKIDIYLNMDVYLSTGEVGCLESPFGKKGKVRVTFAEDLLESTLNAFEKGCNVQLNAVRHFHLYLAAARRISLFWNLSNHKSGYCSYLSGESNNSVKMNSHQKARSNHLRRSAEIVVGACRDSVDENIVRPKKGYIEIRKNPRNIETRKTLSEMQEKVEQLAKIVHKLRVNEKEKEEDVKLDAKKVEDFDEEIRLSADVNCPVERMSFTVRTPDRRLLLKVFIGNTNSRTILEMLRGRKVRINEVVIYDFAIVCKPMDTFDIWKGELEENPAFARVDRFQILRMILSPCCQYYTIHAIALRDFLVENWFPWEISKNSQNT